MGAKNLFRVLLIGISMFGAASSALAITYTGKIVKSVVPPDDRPCMFFSLEGVSVAEPGIKPNDPWFAVPMTYQGFKEIFALVLTAKVSQGPVKVATNGGAACGGYPTIAYVYML